MPNRQSKNSRSFFDIDKESKKYYPGEFHLSSSGINIYKAVKRSTKTCYSKYKSSIIYYHQ